MPKGVKRDPRLDCALVKIYRDVIHLQLNYLQREYVVEKVSCCERGQRLWKSVLEEQMLTGRNPKDVPRMVKLWEGLFWCNSEPRPFEQWKENGNGIND